MRLHSQLLYVIVLSFVTLYSRMTDDHVRPLTDEERALYKLLSTITQRPASSLSTRWREPSLTVHNIEVSGPKSKFAFQTRSRLPNN